MEPIFAGLLFSSPLWLTPAHTLPDVVVQPRSAIKLATPYLDEHATVIKSGISQTDKPLKTSIVKKRDWYYVQQSNYPAKSIHAYLKPAVKVHAQTGKITFTKQQTP